jgi:hypothetical protein
MILALIDLVMIGEYEVHPDIETKIKIRRWLYIYPYIEQNA